MRLLVADDKDSAHRLIADILKPIGCQIDFASSGLEAVTLLDQHAYDLIITDLLMPMGTGFDVIDTVSRRKPPIPVLICSAYATDAVRELVREYGPHEIVTKPFRPEDLLEAVRKLTALNAPPLEPPRVQ